MNPNGISGDVDQTVDGLVESGSCTSEKQTNGPRVSVESNPDTTEGTSEVDPSTEKERSPDAEESVAAEPEDNELSKSVETSASTKKSPVNSVAGETTEDSSARLESTDSVVEEVEQCEKDVTDTVARKSVSEGKENNLDNKGGESSNNQDISIPCEDVVISNKESSTLSIDEVPHDSDVHIERENEKTGVGREGSGEVIKENIGRDDLTDSNAEESSKPSEFSKAFEENGADANENDVEVISDVPSANNAANSGANNVKSEKVIDKRDCIDDAFIPRKRARVGRPRKNSRPSESIIENGSPEQEVHADESSPGRPRRKAAQKAGDQIKQIVGNEEVNEAVDKEREKEDWNTEPNAPPRKICYQCCRLRPCQYHLLVNGVSRYMCTTPCFQAFRRQHPPKPNQVVKETVPGDGDLTTPTTEIGASSDVGLGMDVKVVQGKDRTLVCAFCHRIVLPPTASDKSLSWETMEFCNEACLGKYQDQLSSSCSHCKVPVQRISMGKYCVRFGYHIKQFCCSTCLEEFKKGLKTCTYCQKDISNGAEGFLAPVGDKGQFKDFCSPACMEQYDHISSGTLPPTKEAACAVCDKVRNVISEVVTRRLGKDQDSDVNPPAYSLCSEPCFAAFKFVNEVKTEQCESCLRYFDTSKPEEKPTVFFHDGGYHCCCRACLNIYILTRRSIVQCNWCRVKKYDFDMIKRISSSGQVLTMCSLNCLSLYHVSISAVSSRRVKCDFCKELSQAQYHLTMSDATVRNFCSYECVMTFQSQYSKSPLTLPEEDMTFSSSNSVTGPVPASGVDPPKPPVPVISAVQSLATDKNVPIDIGVSKEKNSVAENLVPIGVNHANAASTKTPLTPNVTVSRQIIIKPPNVKEMKNKSTSCKPITQSKSVGCQTSSVDMSTQTEKLLYGPVLIPVPVPIYVPAPMAMYSNPFPVPIPFPLPVPVPIVLPSKLSLKELVQKSEVISSVTPEEAEILMMAELVADDDKDATLKAETKNSNSPDTLRDSPCGPDTESDHNLMSNVPSLLDPGEDLEESIAVSKVPGPAISEDETSTDEQLGSDKGHSRKRKARGRGRGSRSKRSNTSQPAPIVQNEPEIEPPMLKASLGVSAWQVWVQQKNSELSKVTSNSRRLKLFKTELLRMTLEELNYALCLFVKEVRKPGSGMYAPDTIFYFCLGIQHYLMENGRVDNIFTDLYFEKFTECLDQVATTFPPLTKETKVITTRVEEEHLWESRQLGAHSPYVLLSTLVFFNTKYFHLWTVEDHSKLTFANVIKVWNKSHPRQPNAGEHNTSLLRLFPTNKTSDENCSQKRVYEQEENTAVPIRCPVKHYEFYLSKCPDPLKKDGDLFYLLPERTCVPDSPVWYSSTCLGPDALAKILHRILMVKEVNKSYAEELTESSSQEEKTSEEKEVQSNTSK